MVFREVFKSVGGPGKAAKLLGVEPRYVFNWQSGRVFPKAKNLHDIYLLSRKKLDITKCLVAHVRFVEVKKTTKRGSHVKGSKTSL